MRWHICKRLDEWFVVGITVHVFDTWQEAVDWVEHQRPGSEPCS